METNKTGIGHAIYLLFILMFLVSCKDEIELQESEILEEIDNENSTFQKIIAAGFKKEDIEILDEAYLVEGDILIRKDLDDHQTPHKQERKKQYHTGFLISFQNQNNINVFVDPGIGPWFNPATAAIANWNNINGSRLQLNIVGEENGADLVIIPDDDTNDGLIVMGEARNALAVAAFPSGGNVGEQIIVDNELLSCQGNLNFDQYRTIIQHEIGHAIGFRHSFWLGVENASGLDIFGNPFSAVHINGTPTGNDPASIMNVGCPVINRNFSNFDVLAAISTYPDFENSEVGISLDSDRVGILIDGTLFVKEGNLDALWIRQNVGVSKFQIEGDRIAVLVGDLLRVKEGGLSQPWVNVDGLVQDFQLEGNRIAVLRTNKDLRVKEGGLSASWVTVDRGVDAFSLENNRIGVLKSDLLRVKEGGLSQPWADIDGLVQDFQLEGNRIAALRTNKVLRVKEGALSQPWADVDGLVQGFQLEGNRIAVLRTNKVLRVKEGGLSQPWVNVDGLVQDFQLEGNRIAVLRTNKDLRVKEGGLSAGWVTIDSGVDAFRLEGIRIGVIQANSFKVKQGGVNALWTFLIGR